MMMKVMGVSVEKWCDSYKITGYDGTRTLLLGEFESKERAMEILDEIHSYIENGKSVYTIPNK